jgi:hypothetical protein
MERYHCSCHNNKSNKYILLPFVGGGLPSENWRLDCSVLPETKTSPNQFFLVLITFCVVTYDWVLSKHGRALNGCKISVSKLRREKCHLGYLDYKKIKVKQSCYKPGVPPEGPRKLRFSDFLTTAQDGGKVFSLMHRAHFPPGNTPGTHFC